jgi:AcrR family transcriptional regulator
MPAGRPRAFDADKALDRALKVFWKKGYEGASLPDLTKAMGINRPSLYAAFGNKEELFRKALERYLEGPARHVKTALAEPTARRVVEKLFDGSIAMVTDGKNPRGCFLVQAALACGDDADPLRRELAKQRASLQGALCERFERAQAEKDLPKDIDAEALARYVVVVNHGMAVQAAGGASASQLREAADIALRAWPT